MALTRPVRLIFLVLAVVLLAGRASAATTVTFGTSWDGPGHSLQDIVDGLYGPGAIDVATDYIGADGGDLDPWFWVDQQVRAVFVRAIAGNASSNVLGWYKETGVAAASAPPAILGDNVHDGVIFNGAVGEGSIELIMLDSPTTKIGFYLDPNGAGSVPNAPGSERFFTNRFYNDLGPAGAGAVHAPTDGDVQALVYDVSAFTGPNTWLVCFEDLDSGAMIGPCCDTTDNDYNDLVFLITAFGATPTTTMSFGAVKARYHR